jgi:PadR family transcriptional regulator, regulatory protein AphA
MDHSILAVLSFRPSSGYDIKAEFEHKAASLYWGMSYGSIYPKLKKLENEGYIYALESDSTGRKKTLFELTAKGWEELEGWLASPPAYPVQRDELFMRIAAWHDDMDSTTLIGHLQKRKTESKDILQFIKEWPRNGTSYINVVGMLAIKYSETILEAEIKWVDETVRLLTENKLPASQDPNGLGEKIRNRRKKALQLEAEDEDPERLDV